MCDGRKVVELELAGVPENLAGRNAPFFLFDIDIDSDREFVRPSVSPGGHVRRVAMFTFTR